MKLYAIKNKTTGELANINGNILTFRSLRLLGKFYADITSGESLLEERFESLRENEVVRLRTEPIEPCEWCGDDIGGSIHRPNNGHEKAWRKDAVRVSLGYYHFNFCPNCGRSLE